MQKVINEKHVGVIKNLRHWMMLMVTVLYIVLILLFTYIFILYNYFIYYIIITFYLYSSISIVINPTIRHTLVYLLLCLEKFISKTLALSLKL